MFETHSIKIVFSQILFKFIISAKNCFPLIFKLDIQLEAKTVSYDDKKIRTHHKYLVFLIS